MPMMSPRRSRGKDLVDTRWWTSARAVTVTSLAVTSLAVTALATPAQAHTDLIATTPEAGSRVSTPPASVRLTFTEEISVSLGAVSLEIDGASEGRLRISAGREAGEVVAAVPDSVLASSPAGAAWVVNYRVTSSDGHPIAGSLQFEVVDEAPRAIAAPDAGPAPTPDPGPSDTVDDEEDPSSATTPVEPVTTSTAAVPTWIVPAGVLAFLALLVVVALRRLGRSE